MGRYLRCGTLLVILGTMGCLTGCDKIPFLNKSEEVVVEEVEEVEEDGVKPVGVTISGLATEEEAVDLKESLRVTGLMKQGSSQYARVNDELVREGDTFVLKIGDVNYLMTVVEIEIASHNVSFQARAE